MLALRQLVLGHDPRLRLVNGLCAIVAALNAVWAALTLLVMIPLGLLPDWLGQILALMQVMAALTFYPLVRSGATRHWRDPALVIPQVLWSSVIVMGAYLHAPSLRPAALQTLCLIQVFGFLSLTPTQARWTGAASIALLLGALLWLGERGGVAGDHVADRVHLLASCFVIGLLSWQSARFAQVRERVTADKRMLRKALEDIRHITLHDSLTGLPNRQYMQECIDAERDRARRTGSFFCVALLDLDHFKQVNDQHGHSVGDEVLVRFAMVAREVLRQTDLIGRWGGEEFMVLLPDTDPAQLGLIGLDRLRERLARTQVSGAAADLRVRFSAGIACAVTGETTEQLMARADQALYQAKAAGRDRCQIAADFGWRHGD
jgi:diguanylate cyclase (GGDEF)-like protein